MEVLAAAGYGHHSVVRRGRMHGLLRRLVIRAQSEFGASLVEYVLLVAFIAVAAILAIAFFGSQLAANYSSVASEFPS
jgi:Flp pilus assembly pilin Flp